jgi:hypothetical protein
MAERVERPGGVRRIGEEAVLDKTGKCWEDWFAILDGWDAGAKGHTATARYLHEAHGVASWWAQAVTGRYEYERVARTL